MRLAGVLIGPAILAFAIVTGLSYVVPEASQEPLTAPTGLTWSGRVFKDRVQFARWLEVRGVSYQEWSRLHPGSPWAIPREAEPPSASVPRTLSASTNAEDSDSVVVAALGAAIVLLSGLLAIGAVVLVRMKRTVDRLAEPSLLEPRFAPVSSENGATSPARAPPFLTGAGDAARRGVEAAKPRIENARLAARRTVEAAGPRVESARLAARRTVEAAAPRVESAGLAARRGVEVAAAETAAASLFVQYAIAVGRERGALLYAFAGVLSATVGIAIAILV
jgi:hypothetical protein